MTRLHTLVIGLGEIGAPLMALLKKADPTVQGLDLPPQPVQGPIGVMHVCYPFLEQENFVRTTCDYVQKFTPMCVVVHSTVLPGTSRALEQASGVPVVYSPVRGKHVKMQEDLQHYKKFVSSTHEAVLDAVEHMFAQAGMQPQRMPGPVDTLELAKLLETTYFGLLIAWAQEMERFAGAVGGDYYAMAAFFKEIPYLPPKTFVPGFIGGHCVMPNIALIEKMFDSPFLKAIQTSNVQKENQAFRDETASGRTRVEPV
jgi:UDP-N-acetyl-D-mannosaminuronate dehydrogenase